jgi:hypothetical protein
MGTHDELMAEVRELRAEVAALRQERAATDRTTDDGPLTRRRLFGLAGGALAGGAVLAMTGSTPVAATTGTMQYGANNDAGLSETLLVSTCESPTLVLRNHLSPGGGAISQALNCFSSSADGLASSAGGGGGNGVLGLASNPSKSGVRGDHLTGSGVTGQATSGVGVRGRGTQAGSRGGVFEGQAAALNLVASTRATHPSSGRRGDLLVDASGRLWFCKGGTTWKQLA